MTADRRQETRGHRPTAKLLFLVCGLWSLVCSLPLGSQAFAQKTRRGFYEGPYLNIGAGVMQFDWDVNQRTGIRQGGSFEPFFTLGFGWNIVDWIAAELRLRYTTNANGGNREHIAGASVGPVFTLITPMLTDFKKWKILPFIKPSAAVQIAGLPGDPSSGDKIVILKGFGPGISGGVRFLHGEYFFFGVEAREEAIRMGGVVQDLSPGGPTQIYKGGWKQQFETYLMAGVHF